MKIRTLLKTSVSLLLVVAVFYFIGREIFEAGDDLKSQFHESVWGYAALNLLFMIVVQLLLVLGWRWILRLHAVTPSFETVIRSFAVPNLGKYLPGKVLFLVGKVELVKRMGVNRAIGLSCFILENIYITAAAALMSLPAVLSLLGIRHPAFITLGFLLGFLVLLPTIRSGLPQRTLGWALSKTRPDQAASAPEAGFGLRPFWIYLILWSLYGIAGWILAAQIYDVQLAELLFVVSAFVAAWLLGFMAVIAPGGLGVREGALVLLLSDLLTPAEAGALAILSRLTWTIAELGLGFLILMFSSLTTTSSAPKKRSFD